MNDTLKHADKICKLGRKYNLKSIEVSQNAVKIEFNDVIVQKKDKKLSKETTELLEADRQRLVMDELQLMDPEAYEEIIAQDDQGLKER